MIYFSNVENSNIGQSSYTKQYYNASNNVIKPHWSQLLFSSIIVYVLLSGNLNYLNLLPLSFTARPTNHKIPQLNWCITSWTTMTKGHQRDHNAGPHQPKVWPYDIIMIHTWTIPYPWSVTFIMFFNLLLRLSIGIVSIMCWQLCLRKFDGFWDPELWSLSPIVI